MNPDNWKAHWRQGVAVMHMAQRKFRTKQAVAAFERCAACSSLPDNKRGEVQQAIQGGKARLADQDANVSEAGGLLAAVVPLLCWRCRTAVAVVLLLLCCCCCAAAAAAAAIYISVCVICRH